MRKSLLLLSAVCLFSTGAFATVHTIHVAEFAFTPAAVPNVHVGDTVKWIWDNGSHTTTSTTIPTGATAWDENLKASAPTYSYVPTVAGTYNYKCDPHAAMGMVGSFTVAAATAVAEVSTATLFTVYPNPASTTLHVQFADNSPASVSIYNVVGQQVLNSTFNGQADINLSGFANGVYVIRAQQGNQRDIKTVVVSH